MRLDIRWADLMAGLIGCCSLAARDELNRSVTEHWPDSGEFIPCLSVRSGFDLLLQALELPQDSEVLLTALNVPHMPQIVHDHGLIAVPFDFQPEGFSPDISALERAITEKSRVLVVAHLFGERVPMEPIVELARKHNLIVVEDCAQSYSGTTNQFHPESDVALFSFGPIKTATALQGGLLRIKDTTLKQKAVQLQELQPIQSRWSFAKRVVKFAALKIASMGIVFGLFVRICHMAHIDYDLALNRSTRNFADRDLFRQLRMRPSVGLLSMMNRRLQTFDPTRIQQRILHGQRLTDYTQSRRSPDDVFWVFPVVCRQPEEAVHELRAAGFDATLQSRLAIVTHDFIMTPNVSETYSRTVFLPWYPELDGASIETMGRIVQQYL